MKKFFLFLLFCMSISPVSAYVIGGTNLSFSGYPTPNCYLNTYNPDEYDVNRYINCINDYVENANNDIKRIREAAEEAVNDAKRKLRSL